MGEKTAAAMIRRYGSLAGLLWMDLLRRAGVEISLGKFVRLGTLVLLPTLTLSLVMLWLLAPP